MALIIIIGASTVRTTSCTLLTQKGRCKACSNFRSTLRSFSCREQKSTDTATATNSHTKYSALSSEDKTTRLRNLHHSLKVTKLHTKYLEDKMAKLIESEALQLHERDSEYVYSITSDVRRTVEETFPSQSPQRIFWEQQAKYNNMKNKRQMRWHPLVIR